MPCYKFKGDAAVAVNDWLLRSRPGSQLTMTITPESYVDCSVPTVIDTSSEDTDILTAQFFSATQVNT